MGILRTVNGQPPLLFVPKGFAHRFQTLTDNTEVYYQMSEFFCPEAARGVRVGRSRTELTWPECEQRIISPRDLSYPQLPIVWHCHS